MKLFFKKFGSLFFVFIALATIVSLGSLLVLRHSSFYKSSFLVNQVPQDNLDYIILGASDGLTTLNTKVIDSVLSLEGINLSMDDTALSSHYLMLQHYLAEGKSTKYCVLVAGPSSFDQKKAAISDNDYRFLMYNNRPYVSNYFKQFSDKRAKILYYSKWAPFIGMSYYNAELFYPSLISLFNFNKRNRFDDKGNFTYPVLDEDEELITNFDNISVDFSNPFVNLIKTLCEDNNIELICYLSPMKSRKAIINSSAYTVINHSNALTNTKYFYDEIHVNTLGRDISSINFTEAFKKKINN